MALLLAGSLLLAGCTSSTGSGSTASDDPSQSSPTPSDTALRVESLETPPTSLLEDSPGFIDTFRDTDAYGAPIHLVGVRAPGRLHTPVEEWASSQAASFTTDISALPVPSEAKLEMTPSQCGAAGSVLCFVINSQVTIPQPDPSAAADPNAPTATTAGPGDSPREPQGAPKPGDPGTGGPHPDHHRPDDPRHDGPDADGPASPDPAVAPADGQAVHVQSKAKAWITDFEAGTVVDTLALLSDEGRAELESVVAEHLVSEGRLDPEVAKQLLDSTAHDAPTSSAGTEATPGAVTSSPTASEPVPELFDAVFLNGDGTLTVLASQGILTTSEEGIASFLVSEAADGAIASLLTPEGVELRKAFMSGTEPTPIPVPPVDCEQLTCIALTFDDGPGPYTGELLDTLADKDVKATFFLIGRSAASDPAMVAREGQEGHVVASHSWSHPSLPDLSWSAMESELDQTDQAIEDAGVPRPTLVRPPYGAVSPALLSLLGQRGQAAVLWNVDTLDWKNRDVSMNIHSAVDNARPGSILLMHDIHPESVQAVPAIIDQLEAQGYTFVTVPELMGGDGSQFAGKTIISQHEIH